MKRFLIPLPTLIGIFALAAMRPAVNADAGAEPAVTGYVAMGSSFAAGPGLGTRNPLSPEPCAQSSENYPHLLALKRGWDLTDVTCSGATTRTILEPEQNGLPPQLDAVHLETQLVTITIGGNDVAYIGNLMAWSCGNAPERFPQTSGTPCGATPAQVSEDAWIGLEARMRSIVARVHARAPQARVVFVDYVTVLPDAGACPKILPLTEEQLRQARETSRRLAALTEKVARDTGARLLKASELTRSHDVCSVDPWVNGLTFAAAPGAYNPASYHPKERAMAAIADALDRMIGAL